MTDLRLAEKPNGAPRGEHVTIRVDGREIPAFAGESLGAALHASGITILSRSIKYHRPRGLFCMVGKCANCLMRVDDRPNVRVCTTPVRDGMTVASQNAFPSARRDVLGVIDRVYPKEFDYHAKFIRPKFMTPVFHGVIRRMAGWGKLAKEGLRVVTPTLRRVEVDAVVAGGGPAGMSAALALRNAGASVIIVDERPRLGGDLLRNVRGEGLDAPGPRVAARLANDLVAAGARIHTGSGVVGIYPEGEVVIMTPDGIIEAHPRVVIIASGVYEAPLLFPGNDLPGIMGGRAASMLVNEEGVLPGRRVVIAGATPLGARLARDLAAAGAHVVAVVGPGVGGVFADDARARPEWRIASAEGGRVVEGVTLTGPAGATEKVPCDAVVIAVGESPRPELFQQAECAMGWDDDLKAYVPEVDESGRTSVPHVFAAGDAVRPAASAANMAAGARAGEAAAAHLSARPAEDAA